MGKPFRQNRVSNHQCHHLKRENTQLKTAVEKKNAKIQNLQAENVRLQEEVAEAAAKRTVELRDEKGCFTISAQKCIMELAGEKEVSATRCGEVIETVCRHVAGYQIPPEELPSLRTVLRIMDKGHVMSKLQVADAFLQSNHFDLHTDGTTKCGKKVVGQQVTLDNGESLACGFSIVSTEDSATLLDITTNLLQELTDLCEDQHEGEADQLFKKLLRKLTATMSDRASVNKTFNQQLNTLRKDALDTDDDRVSSLQCTCVAGLPDISNKQVERVNAGAGRTSKNNAAVRNKQEERNPSGSPCPGGLRCPWT